MNEFVTYRGWQHKKIAEYNRARCHPFEQWGASESFARITEGSNELGWNTRHVAGF
jgi:hypothetical protein